MGKGKLPPNWKKAKGKDGAIYYFNSITKQQRTDEPPQLPDGWSEKLHESNGRVCYYHKKSHRTQYDFPSGEGAGGRGGESDDDDGGGELGDDLGRSTSMMGGLFKSFGLKKKLEGLERTRKQLEGDLGRAISFTPKGKGKEEEGMSRTATMKRRAEKKEAKQAAKNRGTVGEEASTHGSEGRTKEIFISCSTLIKEVKLCVEPEHHAQLDALFKRLTSREISSSFAVKHLTGLVGATIVQQAR